MNEKQIKFLESSINMALHILKQNHAQIRVDVKLWDVMENKTSFVETINIAIDEKTTLYVQIWREK